MTSSISNLVCNYIVVTYPLQKSLPLIRYCALYRLCNAAELVSQRAYCTITFELTRFGEVKNASLQSIRQNQSFANFNYTIAPCGDIRVECCR